MIDLLIPPAMALMNRFRGHASKYKKYLPRPWSQLLLALPFGIIAYNHTQLHPIIPYQEYVTGVIITLITMAMFLTGWGNGHDMGTRPRGKPETVEWPLYLTLYGKIPEYWYDFIFMAWRGMLITMPCGIVTGNIPLVLSGAVMALAYAIGHAVMDYAVDNDKMEPRMNYKGEAYLAISFMPRHLDVATDIGELLTGLFIGIALITLT